VGLGRAAEVDQLQWVVHESPEASTLAPSTLELADQILPRPVPGAYETADVTGGEASQFKFLVIIAAENALKRDTRRLAPGNQQLRQARLEHRERRPQAL